MEDRRELLAPGYELFLGGVRYGIEGVEGCGGSAVVYRASYEDALVQGCRHKVLIKELFPYDAKGGIYRDQTGRICCKGDKQEWLERCRQSFYQGNQANLELLGKAPEKVPGNLNSYEAYGTFYSVLAVHGGNNLERILSEGLAQKSLEWTAKVVLKILDALECFHQNGLLHLDISPDNILLLPERAMLIDYNSVWNMGQGDGGFCYLSEKEGYSAPEVRLRMFSDIGPATDLYSVCAVWFFMATGRRLSQAEIVGNGLGRCFPRNMDIFQGEPETACLKLVQIMKKGLHILSRKRYGSVAELYGEVRELLQRIDGKGISHSALWENSRRRFKGQKGPGEGYLERSIQVADGKELAQGQCWKELESGGLLLLSGSGGIGKTRLLKELWGRAVERYSPSAPVVMYVPLADYQETREKNYYIRDYVARHLFLLEENGAETVETAMEEEQGWKYLLLLDGLNEAGPGRGGLVKEIEELGKKPAAGILVTDRWDSVKEYGLCDFSSVRLLPLTDAVVAQELKEKGIEYPSNKKLKSMLSNPMMLVLYEKTVLMALESGRVLGDKGIDGPPDALIGLYLDGLCEKEQRMAAGDPAEQLRYKYLIYHFLPDMAAEMRKRRKTVLTLQEVLRLASKSYRALGTKEFGRAFPDYLGKSRVMLAGMKNASEWFDYGVAEQLWERMNLVVKSEDGNYGLVHDNFLGYLAGIGVQNRKKIGRYIKREKGKKAGAAMVLGAVLMLGGRWAVRDREPGHAAGGGRLIAETTPQLKEAVKQMVLNVEVLGMQLAMQQQILEEAGKKEVLEGDEKALADFLEYSRQKQKMGNGYTAVRDDGKEWLEWLEETEPEFPCEILGSLYGRTFEMDVIAAEALGYLEEGMARKGIPYSGREKLVSVYRQYLDSYGEAACREMNLVLSCVDPELAKEAWDSVEMAAVFSGYIRQFPYQGEDKSQLERYLRTAREDMKNCVREMKAQGYDISLPGWGD